MVDPRTREHGVDYDPAPPGYEWRIRRMPRAVKILIWFVALVALASLLWFWVYPAALNLLPDNF